MEFLELQRLQDEPVQKRHQETVSDLQGFLLLRISCRLFLSGTDGESLQLKPFYALTLCIRKVRHLQLPCYIFYFALQSRKH